MTPEQAIQWIEDHTTLHMSVEFLYVVDGYELTMMYDSNPVYKPFHGETIVAAEPRQPYAMIFNPSHVKASADIAR